MWRGKVMLEIEGRYDDKVVRVRFVKEVIGRLDVDEVKIINGFILVNSLKSFMISKFSYEVRLMKFC